MKNQMYIHMQKGETWFPSHAMHKNQFQVDFRTQCENLNNETSTRWHEEYHQYLGRGKDLLKSIQIPLIINKRLKNHNKYIKLKTIYLSKTQKHEKANCRVRNRTTTHVTTKGSNPDDTELFRKKINNQAGI